MMGEGGLDLGIIIQIVSFFIIVAAAAVWLRSTLVKQRHEELEALAETRGERIKDQDARIRELELKVEKLAGQIEAIQKIKATEIADEVVSKLRSQQVVD